MSLLGIDIGTTGCKAGVFREDGKYLAQSYREYDILHPEPGGSELDSREVWRKTREVIADVSARAQPDPITALSVSSLGEAFVPVTRDRRILGNSILCMDDRGRDHADRLLRDFGPERFYEINGNMIGPNFSLPKMLWMRDHRPEEFEAADYFLLWADCIAFLLGGEPAAVHSLASRTLLLDVGHGDWSDELLAWSGLFRDKLGRVVPGGEIIGTVDRATAGELGLPPDVRIVAGGHDQCCNALGCGAVHDGEAVCGMGTFECITSVFKRPKEPLKLLGESMNMEHHVVPELFVSFMFNYSGAIVKWFRDTFARAEMSAGQGDVYARLNAEIPPEPTRLLVLPHFETPVFPRHLPDTSGIIMGLKTHTTRGEILKAIMECTSLFFVDSLHSMETIGCGVEEFVASGGGAKSNAWLQIKADVFGLPFVRPAVTEAGLLGAALLAGLGTGVYPNPHEAVLRCVHPDRIFEPDEARHAQYREKHALYRQLYDVNRDLLRQL